MTPQPAKPHQTTTLPRCSLDPPTPRLLPSRAFCGIGFQPVPCPCLAREAPRMRDTQPIFDIPLPFVPPCLAGCHGQAATTLRFARAIPRRTAPCLRHFVTPSLRRFVATPPRAPVLPRPAPWRLCGPIPNPQSPIPRSLDPSIPGSLSFSESHSRVSFSPLYNMRLLRPFHFPAQNNAFLGRPPRRVDP